MIAATQQTERETVEEQSFGRAAYSGTEHLTDLSMLYIRYAFPMAEEPGPKRHLDLVHYLQAKGCDVTVITCGANFMTGHRTGDLSMLRATEY